MIQKGSQTTQSFHTWLQLIVYANCLYHWTYHSAQTSNVQPLVSKAHNTFIREKKDSTLTQHWPALLYEYNNMAFTVVLAVFKRDCTQYNMVQKALKHTVHQHFSSFKDNIFDSKARQAVYFVVFIHKRFIVYLHVFVGFCYSFKVIK